MAVPPLRALVAARHEVVVVVSRADKRRGRSSKTSPSPVKAAALELGIPVETKVADALLHDVDLAIVVAFGQIIRREALDAVPFVNLHFSLLSRWRGAAPVERAILAGDERTGVCLMAIEESLDTGGVYRRSEVPIGDDDTLDVLLDRLVGAGSDLLLGALEEGFGEPAPQEGEPTYAEKLDAEDLHLDWERPAVEVARVVRLGRAWTTYRGKRLLVLDAAPLDEPAAGPPASLHGDRVVCGEGQLQLVTVRPEGRSAMDVRSLLNGSRPEPGDRFGESV
jgi:methionyl-tRNA formyltransferase